MGPDNGLRLRLGDGASDARRAAAAAEPTDGSNHLVGLLVRLIKAGLVLRTGKHTLSIGMRGNSPLVSNQDVLGPEDADKREEIIVPLRLNGKGDLIVG